MLAGAAALDASAGAPEAPEAEALAVLEVAEAAPEATAEPAEEAAEAAAEAAEAALAGTETVIPADLQIWRRAGVTLAWSSALQALGIQAVRDSASLA